MDARTSLLVAGVLLLPRLVLAAELPLDRIKLPQGFGIEPVARVPNAREMPGVRRAICSSAR